VCVCFANHRCAIESKQAHIVGFGTWCSKRASDKERETPKEIVQKAVSLLKKRGPRDCFKNALARAKHERYIDREGESIF
jgi:hypothetical protein